MKAFAYGIALAGLVLVARSATADSSLDRVRACMLQQNDAARPACYDKELGRTTAPAAATAPTAAPVAAPTTAPARAVAATAPLTAAPARAVTTVAAAPAAVTATASAPAAAAAPSTPSAGHTASAASAAAARSADFGMTPELLHKQQVQAGIKPSPPPPESLSAKVAKIGTYGNGLLLVTLDNGQVWEQQESGDAQLAVGDAVKISRGMFGALWMDDASHRRTRVKRIQ